jgi:ribose transport system permease protein
LGFVILTSRLANMQFIKERNQLFPNLSKARLCQPQSYYWPNFLKRDNLINIANQIVVIAVLAIGMTMVIITGGIDLSVGSLIALSAVVAAWLIAALGGDKATVSTMILCSLAAVGVCAFCGLVNGVFVAVFQIPPFIVTLGLMLVASGFAYIISSGESIYQMPERYTWLGRGDILALPVGVWLMFLLYLLGHFFMNNTVLGRNIYAVGGNADAAHLSGISISFVLIFVYTISAIFAGLGGVIVASQLKSGAPQYGLMYELYVIAAVVVGGTSLRGGEGRILGTLLGAFLIAIIQNGMNLTGVEAYVQKVVLGLVILTAVLFDTIRSKGWPDSLKFRVKPRAWGNR